MKEVQIGGLTVSNDRPLTVIAGPCQLETLEHALMIAETIRITSYNVCYTKLLRFHICCFLFIFR